MLERYIAGWRSHDTNRIIQTLSRDCVVIESFGPIYRGHDCVESWVSAWVAEQGRVIDWTVHDVHSVGNVETAEWTFHYTWRGKEQTFDGATIAKLQDGRISYLREYALTAPLYEWQGEWRPF